MRKTRLFLADQKKIVGKVTKIEGATKAVSAEVKTIRTKQSDQAKELDAMRKEINTLKTAAKTPERPRPRAGLQPEERTPHGGAPSKELETQAGTAASSCPFYLVDPRTLAQHRRTILIDGIVFTPDEAVPGVLLNKVKAFLSATLEIDQVTMANFGNFSARRRSTKAANKSKAYVELLCADKYDRDCVFAHMPALTRKKDKGRMLASYPPEWDKLLGQKLFAARQIRNHRQEGDERQIFYSQVRYSDTEEGLSVYVKKIDGGYWMPLSRARKEYDASFFPKQKEQASLPNEPRNNLQSHSGNTRKRALSESSQGTDRQRSRRPAASAAAAAIGASAVADSEDKDDQNAMVVDANVQVTGSSTATAQ